MRYARCAAARYGLVHFARMVMLRLVSLMLQRLETVGIIALSRGSIPVDAVHQGIRVEILAVELSMYSEIEQSLMGMSVSSFSASTLLPKRQWEAFDGGQRARLLVESSVGV